MKSAFLAALCKAARLHPDARGSCAGSADEPHPIVDYQGVECPVCTLDQALRETQEEYLKHMQLCTRPIVLVQGDER